MTAPSETRTSIWSAQTLTAGAGNTSSGWFTVNTKFAVRINIQLTNGATGPTVAPQVQIQIANDSGHTLPVNYGGALLGDSVNSSVNSWSILLDMPVGAFQLVAGSNTGQAVTVDADYATVDGIA